MTSWEPQEVSREPQRRQSLGVVSPSPDVDPAPSRDHPYPPPDHNAEESYARAVRLTRFAQLCLAFIIVCCGTAGLLILAFQGF